MAPEKDSEQSPESVSPTPPDVDTQLEERLSQPVLKGTAGIEAAQVWISAFLVVIAGAIAYSNAFTIPFHSEDQRLIVENAPLHHPFSFPDALNPQLPRPVTMLSFSLNWWLFPGSASAFHAVNLLVHLLNGVLLFLLCRRLFSPGISEPVAMLAGLVFVLHPVTTESVDYVVGRAGLLTTLFILLSLLFFLRATRDQESVTLPLLGLSLLAFALAWGSKETAVMLPLLVFLVEWLRSGFLGFFRRWRVHTPYWGLLLVLLTAFALKTETPREMGYGLGLHERLATQAVALLHYLRLTFLPIKLNVCHDLAAPAGFSAPVALLGLGVIGALLIVGLALLKVRTLAGFAVLWYLAMLAPAFLFAPMDAALVERRLYPALAGFALVFPWLVHTLARTPGPRAVAGIAVTALVLGSGALTFARNYAWNDETSLWADAIEKSPNSTRAQFELGRARLTVAETAAQNLRFAGNLDEATRANLRAELEGEFRQAEQHLRRSDELAPGSSLTSLLLGRTLEYLGQTDAAEKAYLEALQWDFGSRQAALHLARVFERRTVESSNQDDLRRSLAYYRHAAQLGPLPPDASAQYGFVATTLGYLEESAHALQAAIGGNEQSPMVPALQQLLAGLQQIQELERQANHALAQNATDVAGLRLRAEALLRRSASFQAAYALRRVLEGNPGDPGIWIMLGFAMGQTGAAEQFLKEFPVPATAPDAPSPWIELARRCVADNAWDAALLYLEKGPTGPVALGRPLLVVGDLAMEAKQYQRAEQYYRRAAEESPIDPTPWLKLCDEAIAMNNAGAATQALEEAQKRGGDSAAIAERREQVGKLPPEGFRLPPTRKSRPNQ
ncbi:MAG: hypothetical protein HY706_18220 [Candidatus Hydrogenedentes bacterium]|nr:hypothetical protein [Candidatus Hydrogenedentota bacterium]